MNVLIDNFITVIAAIQAIVLEQLQTFAFARVTFVATTFSKELLFPSIYRIFFCGTAVFGKEDLFETSNFCNLLFDLNEDFPKFT